MSEKQPDESTEGMTLLAKHEMSIGLWSDGKTAKIDAEGEGLVALEVVVHCERIMELLGKNLTEVKDIPPDEYDDVLTVLQVLKALKVGAIETLQEEFKIKFDIEEPQKPENNEG